MKNRLEIMELINKRVDDLYVYRIKDADKDMPIWWRGIYKPAGVCLHVFDKVEQYYIS